MPAAPQPNIVLIGMPGVGKSTVGVLLAKLSGRDFLDTDVVLQRRLGRTLQDVINRDGRDAFLRLEEECVLSLRVTGCVLATGGSVVYSEPAMRHVREGAVTLHLTIPIGDLERRLHNLSTRGVIMFPGQGIRQLWEERAPLYRRHADLTIDCSNLDHTSAAERIEEIAGAFFRETAP